MTTMTAPTLTFEADKAYSYYPTFRVSIPTGGEATIAVTSADHVHFDANHHCINGGPGDRCWFVYRGEDYGVSFHLNWQNDVWYNSSTHAQKVSNGKEASPTAIQIMRDQARVIVNEFRRQHPEAFKLAERQRLEREIEKKQAGLSEVVQQAAKLKTELASAKLALDAIAPTCAVCGVAGPEHGHYDVTDPSTHKYVSRRA